MGMLPCTPQARHDLFEREGARSDSLFLNRANAMVREGVAFPHVQPVLDFCELKSEQADDKEHPRACSSGG